MKTLKSITIGALLLFSSAVYAQVSVSINIAPAPLWGPVGYTEVRYYYLPGVQAYYDVQSAMFIYYSGDAWVRRTYLPSRYREYDLYSGYKVVLTDYHGDKPYTNFNHHKHQYSRSYQGPSQRTIGDHPGKGHSKTKGSQGKGHKKNH